MTRETALSRSALPLALIVALAAVAASAGAETPLPPNSEAIATAAGAPDGGAPAPPETGTLRLTDHLKDGPGFLRPVGPCGGVVTTTTDDGFSTSKPDKAPHGEVWAGIGTHGYRDIGGAACVPIGKNAAVNIAIDVGQIDGWGLRR